MIAEPVLAAARSLPANWPGWLIIIVIGLLVLRWLLGLLGLGK